MTAVQQVALFRSGLGSTVPQLQVQLFEADLLRANLDFMDAAIQQVAATARSARRPPRDPRAAVWAEYHRRVAEISQLLPVLFVFESAWRTVTAEVMRRHYGNDDGWWHPVRAAIQRRAATSSVGRLGNAPARTEVVKRVEHILVSLHPSVQGALATSYDLIEAGTLKDVEWLIAKHWSAFASAFSTGVRQPPTSAEFSGLFRRVRLARNDAYHHRVVSDRQRVVEASERLLDLIDVHLQSRVTAIGAAKPMPFTFAVTLQPRHR